MLVFITLFSLDNLIVIFFRIQPLFGSYLVVPYLLLMGICLQVFYDEKNHAPWLAFGFGLVYDMYGANLLGIYATLFPMIVILIKKNIVPITPVNFVSIFYVSTVAILIVETLLYILVTTITTRSMSIFSFIQHRLIIILVFNTILLAIVYLPLVKILKPRAEKKVKTIMMDNTSA